MIGRCGTCRVMFFTLDEWVHHQRCQDPRPYCNQHKSHRCECLTMRRRAEVAAYRQNTA